jgi:thiol-disulfide isomerase/thioredoxin
MINETQSRATLKSSFSRLYTLAFLFLLAACGEQRFQPLVAPDFTLPLLNGSGQASLSDYEGKVVYLSFWASWCLPCRQEMPYLSQLRARHHEDGFEVLAVNVDNDPELARAFAAE